MNSAWTKLSVFKKGALSACVSLLLILPITASAASGSSNLLSGLAGFGLGVGAAQMFGGSQGLGGSFFGGSNSVAADAMCNPVDIRCDCGKVFVPNKGCQYSGPQANKHNCPNICYQTTNGYTTYGTCPQQGKCLGSTSGAAGGAQQALGLANQVIGLLNGLKQLAGGGAGASGVPAIPGGCTSYYTVTAPSSDPCAVYTPGVSDNLIDTGIGSTDTSGTSVSDLLNALAGGNASSTGSSVTDLLNNLNPTTTITSSSMLASNAAQLAPRSLTGDVQLVQNGSTIVANLREGLSEVAGFFGAGSFSGSAQSTAGRLCANRPWAGSGAVASIIPDTFFDGLCRISGYQVGATQQQGGGTNVIIQTPPQQTTQQQQPQVNTGTPTVDVWAEPLSVRLGTRTYIFWNSSNVTTCTVQGPSFTQTALSGGAATVAITGASTFTATCTAPDGTQVSDSVTVNLAI